jgi:hypothetical protein
MIITIKILNKINLYLFCLGVFGLILSGLVAIDYQISSIVYNISLALVVCSIGIKILFLEKK